MAYKCFHCGFKAAHKSQFLSNGGVLMVICPQCILHNPPVAEVNLFKESEFEEPNWKVVESNDGLLIKIVSEGYTSSIEMFHDHQLATASASILRPELEGTMWDHHKALSATGNTRSAGFRAHRETWLAANPEPDFFSGIHDTWMSRLQAHQDLARREFQLGPHDSRVEHDGPALEQLAG